MADSISSSFAETQQFGKIWAQCVARAWQDGQFRAALKSNPAGTLLDSYQFTVPAQVALQVVESDVAPSGGVSANTLRMVIPPMPAMSAHEIALSNAGTDGATAPLCLC